MDILEAAALLAGAIGVPVLVSALSGPEWRGSRRAAAVAVALLLTLCSLAVGADLVLRLAGGGTVLPDGTSDYLPAAVLALAVAALLLVRGGSAGGAARAPDLTRPLSVLSGAYLRTDREGVIRLASGTAEPLFGLSAAEMVGRRADSFYRSPQDRETLVRRVADAGGTLSLENVRMRRPDGTVVYVDFSAALIADGSDCDGGLESFVQDVTRRHEIETTQEASEARFRDFAESASDWLWETDAEHRVVWLSDSFRRRSSVPESDLLGKKFWETIPANSTHEISPADLQRWMEAELPIRNFRFTSTGADGRERWRRSSARPYRDRNGQFAGYRGVTSDITSAMEAEHRFQALTENSPDMVFVHRNDRVVYVNPAMIAGFGADSAESFIGRDTLELVHPDERERVSKRRSDQQRGEVGAGRHVVRMLRTDGSEFTGDVSIANIVWDGELAVLVTVRDVTERLALERQIRESEIQYRNLIELLPDAFCVQCDGVLVFTNASARQMLGGPEMPDLRGRKISDFVAPEYHERVLERRRIAMTGTALNTPERMPHIRIDGTRFEAEIVSAPIVWDGRVGTLAIVTDVSERAAAEAARALSEARFRDFAESTSDWFWETDADNRIEWMSETFATRTGLDPANVIGKRLWETMGTDGAEVDSVRACRMQMEQHRPFRNMRYSVRPAEGDVFWRSASGQPRFGDDGTFLGYRGATSDITQERSAEQIVRESEERYRTLVEFLPEGFLIQCEGMIVYANAGARRILGAGSADDIVGKDALSIVAPGWQDRMLELRQAVQRGDWKGDRVRMRHRRLDGTEFDSEVSSAAFQWNGKAATINLLVDISLRLAAERLVREADARFRDFAESTSDWFWETDANLRFIWFSLPVHPLLGLEASDMLVKHPWELAGVDPETDVDWAKVAAAMRERRPIRDAQVDIVNRHGDRFRILLSCTPRFGDDGEFLGYRGSASDITRQVDTENRLRQAMKMEAIGQLTGGISHDFNNLLAIISGNLELIQERVDRDAGVREFVEPALRAAARGADLTQYLLAFSRQQPLNPRPTDINRLIAAMTDPLRRSLGARIDIEVVLAAGGWLAQVDPTQMENAILNLALNARDAMRDGGKLTIETANATLDREYAERFEDVRPGRYLMVSVSDEGTGIPPDLIDRVFDPFVTTKEVGQGSGLGLSMVYGFVKQSGGHIRLYSEVGEGTTVRMYLPKADTASIDHAPQGTREQIPTGNGETILVVEDDPDVLNLVTILLTNLDYRVLKASDAAAAVNLVDSGARPDLLFTDVVLRGGDGGVELAKRVGDRCPGIAVVYMSGYTENSIVHQGVLDEGVLLIGKPFTKAELARMIRRAIDAKDPGNRNV
jgi:PAS domain S-box-containing protein